MSRAQPSVCNFLEFHLGSVRAGSQTIHSDSAGGRRCTHQVETEEAGTEEEPQTQKYGVRGTDLFARGRISGSPH